MTSTRQPIVSGILKVEITATDASGNLLTEPIDIRHKFKTTETTLRILQLTKTEVETLLAILALRDKA